MVQGKMFAIGINVWKRRFALPLSTLIRENKKSIFEVRSQVSSYATDTSMSVAPKTASNVVNLRSFFLFILPPILYIFLFLRKNKDGRYTNNFCCIVFNHRTAILIGGRGWKLQVQGDNWWYIDSSFKRILIRVFSSWTWTIPLKRLTF